MVRFSIIIPVYNRPDEIKDLLESLARQSVKNFEVVIVEDGSTVPCKNVVEKYNSKLDIKYIYKNNEGRSIARNIGMENARGQYFVFFDSDCVIPDDYFKTLTHHLDDEYTDCYGGPDAAHESFSTTQKAINFVMTSFLTTGGIRGGKVQLEKFTPRTFNMGFSHRVYDSVGGFREMFSEDIDMSKRISKAGFACSLIRDAEVWHKRRVDFCKFYRQVYVFGMSRITLKLLYPDSLKLVHTLPAFFVLGTICAVLLGIFASPWWLIAPLSYFFIIFVSCFCKTHSFIVALKSIPAAVIQLFGYGFGFIKAFFTKIVLRKGRDINEEIQIRKGK